MAPLTLYDARPPVSALAREFMLKAFSRDWVAKGVSTETARDMVLRHHPWLRPPAAGVPIPLYKEENIMTTDPQCSPLTKMELVAHVKTLAKRYQAADPQLGDADAVSKVFRDDPSLYGQYVKTVQVPIFS